MILLLISLFLLQNPSSAVAAGAPALTPEQSFFASQPYFSDAVHEMHIWLKKATFDKVVNPIPIGGDACKDNARYGQIDRMTLKNRNPGVKDEVLEFKNIGIKVRGNTSCSNYVKQFKLKFNADAKEAKKDKQVVARMSRLFAGSGKDVQFSEEEKARVKNQSFFGFKTLSLRKSNNDPTLVREKLSSEIFAHAGNSARKNHQESAPERAGPVYRVGFARLLVHKDGNKKGEDFGIYNLTESIEKQMFETRWGEDVITHAFQANLGKATFENLPIDDENKLLTYYEPLLIDGDSFTDDTEFEWIKDLVEKQVLDEKELKDPKKERERAKNVLVEFADQLSRARSAEDLAAFLDIDQILSYMVAVNFTGHWDSAIANNNNDFFVFNGRTKKWQIIVWDLDNTFGSLATNSSKFNWVWNADHDEFIRHSILFQKMMKFYKLNYDNKFREFMESVSDLLAVNDRILKLRDTFGAMADASAWDVLFHFNNHRYAYGYCGVKLSQKAVIGADLNAIYEDWSKRKPRCE